MKESRFELGALVLIDPPPIALLHSPGGKRKLIKRYTECYGNVVAFKTNFYHLWNGVDNTVQYDTRAIDESGLEDMYNEYISW